MKRVNMFNPLHVVGNKISVSDIEGLKILNGCLNTLRLFCRLRS